MGSEDDLRQTLAATTAVLVRTLRALGQHGQPEAANRLAAKAYWALRPTSPDDAERINGAMHYLARLEDELADRATASTGPESTTPPTHKEEA